MEGNGANADIPSGDVSGGIPSVPSSLRLNVEDTSSSKQTGEYEKVSEDEERSSRNLVEQFVDNDMIQHDLERGVAYLQKIGDCGTSVYEHLRDIIKKILEQRPDNVIDFFEEYSRQVRVDSYYQRPESFIEPWISARSIQYARLQMSNFELFVPKDDQPPVENDAEEFKGSDEGESLPETNYEELLNYFLPHLGLGFPKRDTLAFIFAMKKMEKIPGVQDIRFWGKIYGLEKDYFIVETTLSDEERERRMLENENEDEHNGELEEMEFPTPMGPGPIHSATTLIPEMAETLEEEGVVRFEFNMPPLPTKKEKKRVVIKSEEPGTGANMKTYFVCQELGEDWKELPDVTPEQINVARKYPCYLTGNLEYLLNTFPKFPGKEINYLRAQIARISAACQISPQGMFMLAEDDEDIDDDGDENQVRTNYVLDEEYEGQTLMNLLDPNMDYWVHHCNELLNQGRVIWWDPKFEVSGEEEQEEEQEEEEEEKEEKEEPEIGKQLLTPVAEDLFDPLIPAWNVKCSSIIDPSKGFAIATSNIWPGAYAIAKERRSENIYFGWGLKHQLRGGFAPVDLPSYEYQYQFGDGFIEEDDPTPEMEDAYRHDLIQRVEEEKGEGEGELEEEEEEEED